MQLNKTSIPFEKVNFFGKLFLDYVNNKPTDFFTYQASAEGIKTFIKNNAYSNLNRTLLVDELRKQNNGLTLSKATKQNIDALQEKTTYTITTGHQLCLATGPAYFIYKILSVINLCEQLNLKSKILNLKSVFVP